MKIYLAARYSRRVELCGYRDQLAEFGYTVTSRWLNGKHQISEYGIPIDDKGEELVERGLDGCLAAHALRKHFCEEDFRDVYFSDLLIAFTEPPRATASRGGRHVEFGIALGRGIPCWVVGYRENLFHWYNDVVFFPTFLDAVLYLCRGKNPKPIQILEPEAPYQNDAQRPNARQ